jgi:ATP-dependent protease ClpP protease subunit
VTDAPHDDELPLGEFWLTDEITPETARTLIPAIRHADRELRVETIRTRRVERPIVLNILSPGGDVFSSLAIYDTLAGCVCPTVGIVRGLAASGATIILMGCDERLASNSSFMMIHQLSTWFAGTHEDTKIELALQKKLMARIKTIYQERTELSIAKIDAMLKKDSWMTTDEAVALKFLTGWGTER